MKQRLLPIAMLLLTVIILLPFPVHANSAEPPSLIVVVTGAPSDVSVTLSAESGVHEGARRQVMMDTYFAFYRAVIGRPQEITLTVTSGERQFSQRMDAQLFTGYNSVVTIDYAKQTLSVGYLPLRTALITALRVLLTLLIEGGIFFLFGFRGKRSWVVFLIINLITQGLLNLALNSYTPYASYLLLTLIALELLVVIVELIGFILIVKEHGRLRRVLYVLCANVVSLVAGGYLIAALPV